MTQSQVLQFGKAGTGGNIGTTVQLQKRSNSDKYDLLMSTPLSLEFNIDNNNSPSDEVIFTAGSGSNRRIIAKLTEKGDLLLAGTVKENQKF